jgi:hypothetical protein
VSTGFDPRSGTAVRGFVDGVTGSAIEGWAFEPGHPTERVVVELRLDGSRVATTVADRHRTDLIRAGIGDAFHGFRFPLKPGLAERRSELAVVAQGVDGDEVTLPLFQRGAAPPTANAPPPPPPAPAVMKAIDQLVASQRALEGRLAELAGRVTDLPVPVGPPAEATEAEARLGALEVWVARLDDRLAAIQAAHPATPAERSGIGGLDTWQVVLIALLAVFGLGALAAFALAVAL